LALWFTNGTGTNWVTTDQSGQVMNDLTVQNNWVYRVADLSQHAGKTITAAWINADTNTGAGSWNEYFSDIALFRQDGTVIPVYHRQTNVSYPTASSSGVSNQLFTNDGFESNVDTLNPTITTTYYVGDQIGSARMLVAGEGWPVSSSTFYPFGQEQSPTTDPNHYKFAGLERDAESELDHATFRQYSSTMGRWTSPDPYLGSMDLTNPQSLNRYAYVGNKPSTLFDPTGLNEAAPCSWYCWIFGYGPYGDGGNPGYCSPQYAQCYEPSSGGGGGSGGSSGDGGGGGGGGSPWNDTYGVPYPGLGNAIGQAINVPPLGGGCEFGTCGAGANSLMPGATTAPAPWCLQHPKICTAGIDIAEVLERIPPIAASLLLLNMKGDNEPHHECEAQYQSDLNVCRKLADPAARSRCYESALNRKNRCEQGWNPLPPLITW
jgi:RHS repeat-associated protein